MNRLIIVAILSLWICGCETTSPSSYIYYEVVHSPEQVAVGDSLLIETRDGATFQGILLRMDEEEIVVTTETQGKVRVLWREVQKVQRVMRARAQE
ncbi:MAG: hypothetical protein OXG87_22075 [Gemmatimonadetes bacterium]|nr:hypothetical protein [Gemmatimonadota bacterium]